MQDYVQQILTHQFEAALAMLSDCIEKCPPEHWDGEVGKYPFWQVAYHTLCFVDLYLARDEKKFEPHAMHPQGWREFDDEYPSRRFEVDELKRYVALCRQKALAALAVETDATLEGPSGHERRKFSRGELYIYNLRHIQHHAGQLSAFLRRVEPRMQEADGPRWVGAGWL